MVHSVPSHSHATGSDTRGLCTAHCVPRGRVGLFSGSHERALRATVADTPAVTRPHTRILRVEGPECCQTTGVGDRLWQSASSTITVRSGRGAGRARTDIRAVAVIPAETGGSPAAPQPDGAGVPEASAAQGGHEPWGH